MPISKGVCLKHLINIAMISTLALCTCPSFAQPVPQQSDHIYNEAFTVRAYALSPLQEAMFNASDDGSTSLFWLAWDETPYTNMERAILRWNDNFTRGTEATGPDDVSFNARFAYGAKGVYALFEVNDNNHIRNGTLQDYENDAVEFLCAKYSAQAMYDATPVPYLRCINNIAYPNQALPEFIRLRIGFGLLNSEAMTTFSLDYWDSLQLTTTSCALGNGEGNGVIENHPGIPLVGNAYGTEAKVLEAYNTWHRQEWFIPWAAWGGPNGAPVGRRSMGQRLAIAFGYNDFDPGQASATVLRWRRADLWSGGDPNNNNQSFDCWGDLLFDTTLISKLRDAGYSNCSDDLYCLWIPHVDNPIVKHSATTTVSTEYYSVDGRRLRVANGKVKAAVGSVVLRRITQANGKTVTIRVPVAVE